MSFNAIRSPPLTPKARAISRLPASLLAVARKSRMSCREGSLPAVFLRGAPLSFATLPLSPPSPRRPPYCSFQPCGPASWPLPSLGAFLRTLGALGGDQRDGLLERDLLRLAIPRQRGVDLAVLDVRPIAAGQNLHLAAKLRVRAEILDDVGAAAAARGRRLLGEKADRAIEADLEHLLGGAEARILAVVLDIGSEPSEARRDRLADSGCSPTSRGRERSASARSRSTSCGSLPLGIEARFGFSPRPPSCSPSWT